MAEQLLFHDVELARNPEPRCPCVLLLDVSMSMSEVVRGAGRSLGYTVQQDGKTYQVVDGGTTRIDLLNDALRAFHADLNDDDLAAQRVEVAIVTFGGVVKVVNSFVTANQFEPRKLETEGDTPMGEAVLKAVALIDERKKQYRANGVPFFRPWIILITDGGPTDNWKPAAERVREGESKKSFAFFAVGVEGADFECLQKFSARKPAPLQGYRFREFFHWLSTSLGSVSRSNPGQEEQVRLEPTTDWSGL